MTRRHSNPLARNNWCHTAEKLVTCIDDKKSDDDFKRLTIRQERP